MPLPNITSFILGTRQPMNYTGPALDAYLAVSREMRARQQQMMSDLKQGQDQMLAGQENARRGEAHQQNMIDAQVNRSIRLEDQSFQREQMEWQREMQPLMMEKARMGLEAAQYERDTLRPLQLEMDRLKLQTGQFQMKAAAAEASLMGQKQASLERDLGTFQRIAAGEIPSPEPSVIEGTFGDMPGGAAGLNGMKVNGLKSGQIYWNHDMAAPMAVVDGDDGNPVAITPPGNYSFEAGKAQRFSPIRPITRDQIAADKLPDVFAGVESPGSPEVLTAKDRVRDAHSYLTMLEKGYEDVDAAKGLFAGIRANMARLPEYQLALADGSLESQFDKAMRHKQRDTQLRWAFGSDDEHREWTTKNPGLLDAFRNLPEDQVKTAISTISDQWKESRKDQPASKPIPQSAAQAIARYSVAVSKAEDMVDLFDDGEEVPLNVARSVLEGMGITVERFTPYYPRAAGASRANSAVAPKSTLAGEADSNPTSTGYHNPFPKRSK